MSEAIRFLHALSQALSTLALYAPGHPATRRSVETAWQALQALLAVDEHPIFFFIGTAPVYSGRALHELREWPYSRRLTSAGVQRLEFGPGITEESLAEFFRRLMARLSSGEIPLDENQAPIPGITFGFVAVEEMLEGEGDGTAAAVGETYLQPSVDLADEVAAMGYVLEQGREGVVARAEVEAVNRILGSLLDHQELPQVAFGDDASYPCIHPINTALLAMAAGRAAGVDPAGRHRLGVAALFHDIGMTQLPPGLGNLPSLTAENRALLETHPAKGARLLFDQGGRGLELAATVAYEHQLRPDGGGYPSRRYRPAPHWAARLVGTAAAYVALRAPRPYRPAWSADRALAVLGEGAGTLFDTEAAKLLIGILRPS